MQNLVSLGTVYIYIYISTILQNKEEVNLINKTRVGGNSTLKSIYIKKGKHNARKLARVFLFCV